MTHEQLGRRFSLADIKSATGDFSDAHIIGKGGFGSVYRGLIDDGRVSVAVKRLATNSNQGKQEFVTEIETLTKLRHRNLVSLIGYCDEHREMILVYEYIANGTLADHLFIDEYDQYSSLIKWKQCLHICIGAARGLDYLHTGSSIIHRDVKSSNILLDEDFVPKISDFGLAKHVINSHSYVSASVKGSFGYFDPSYFTTGRLTRESDTYAFGVVLLEVLSGRRAVDPRLGEDELSLTMWAQEKISKGKTDQIVGSNLKGEISEDCLKTFVHVIKRCLDQEPKKRPTMTRVVVELELALEQQERAGLVTNKSSQFIWSLNAFWNVVKRPSGSRQKDEHDNNEVGDSMVPLIAVPAIPVDELKLITDNFSSKHLIEEEFRHRSVYHGILKNGNAAAIEKLYNHHHPAAEQEFLQQVSIVSSLKHENVVELLGYCVHGGLRFLAFEFSPRGSLYNILHGPINALPSTSKVLSWAERVKIAFGAAKGLEYIHQRGQVHCNIQSRNILVFEENVGKIGGFDLASRRSDYEDDEATPFSSFLNQVYSSPESTVEVSKKTDVYSFGIVLLELLSGRKPWEIQQLLKGGEVEGRRNEVVDDRLNGNYPQIAVAEMGEVAASCLEYEARCRPSMTRVVMSLRSMLLIQNSMQEKEIGK